MLGFPKNTVVTTDQGNVRIQDVDSAFHTINGDQIAAVTETQPIEPRLVCFPRDCFKPGYPSAPTFMTPDHQLFFLGRMTPASSLVGKVGNVGVLENYTDKVYNVVMPESRLMLVNQLTVETGFFYAPSAY